MRGSRGVVIQTSKSQPIDLEAASLDELRSLTSGDQSIEPAGATHWLAKASTVARVSKWRS